MRFLLVFIAVLLSISGYAQTQPYLWPTDSGNYLSSTFGETRSAHFHAGLDIKTWGREGYRVFAAKDGILYRLSVSTRGYGNGIYLKHSNGSYTVYAHLQRFNKSFQSLADSIRLVDFSFEMDAILDTLNITVKQGDVIGYTGSSGIGPPHLHFETRDSLDRPFNALSTNLRVKDRIPPVFSSLIIEPLTKDSRVEGKATSHFTRKKQTADGITDFGTIRASGKVGLSVNVYDRADDVYNAYAVHKLALMHHADTLFYEELNSYSYAEKDQMLLDRIAPFGSTRRGHQRMFEKDGSDNPFYIKVEPNSKIQVTDTSQTYTIVASDYFGNTSKAKVTILKDTTASWGEPELNSTTENWYWHEDWASPDLVQAIDLTKDTLGFPWNHHQQIVALDSNTTVNLARIYPEKHAVVKTPDQRMQARFSPQTFFDTLSVAMGYSIENDEITLSLQPQMLPIRSSYKLYFFMGDSFTPNTNYRLFQVNASNGELSYVNSKLVGRTLHAYPSDLGTFVIKPDSIPPVISDFSVHKNDYGKWVASVKVRDDESGLIPTSATFSVNGQRGIPLYDYEFDKLTFYLPGFVPRKQNTARVYIEDKAGNKTFKTFED